MADAPKSVFTWMIQSVADEAARLKRLEVGTPYLRNGSPVFSSAKNRTVSADALNPDGTISLSSAALATAGSIAPSATDYGFSVVPEETAVTIYWDGTKTSQIPTIRRADKSRTVVPAGSLRITGLVAATGYMVFAFWSPNNKCSVGFVLGTAGTPKFCFTTGSIEAQAQQNYVGREDLGVITFKTLAVGSGAGTGDPAPKPTDPKCVMINTDIETLGDIAYRSELHPESKWIRLAVEGKALNCTHDHPLYSAENGKQDADKFRLGDWIITKTGERKLIEVTPFIRVCTKIHVRMEHGHLFWANDFLSHNAKITKIETPF